MKLVEEGTAEEVAAHAVVARGRVGPGGRKSRGRVAPGKVASPKGRGRVGLASRLPGGPLARASCPGVCRVGSASRLRWPEPPVCKAQSPIGKPQSQLPTHSLTLARVPGRPVGKGEWEPGGASGNRAAASGNRRAASGSGKRRVARGERRVAFAKRRFWMKSLFKA